MSDRAAIQEALPSYEIGLELGRGAWGIVYGGRHRQLERDVAIKHLPRAFAADPSVRARFVSEARTAASLEHPHIVPVYDFVEHGSLCLIVMERCDGSLSDRFRSVGLATDEACAAGLATCAALAYAHTRNVLHRDIKPENLLYDDEDVLKLADFGISRALDEATRLTATGTVIGTPAYMSPEQASGEDLTPASDVYSTGVMLYELLSGSLPFGDVTSVGALIRHHLTEPPRPLLVVAPAVPADIAAVVERALAKSPDDRYDSATAFGVAIGEAATQAFGPGWLRQRRFQLNAASEILAATERAGSGSGRAGTVVVRGTPRRSDPTDLVSDHPPTAPPADPPPPPGAVPPAGGSPPRPGAVPRADGSSPRGATRNRRRLVLAGIGVAVMAIVAAAVLALGGDGGGGGGTKLALGALYSTDATDADDQLAIELAAKEVRAAGGELRVLAGSSARDVDRYIAAGVSVIVGPAEAPATEAVLGEVEGRAVTISQSDFFERDVDPGQRYFRTKPQFTLLAYAAANELDDHSDVVIVDGEGPPSQDGATAALLEQLLRDRGSEVRVVSRESSRAAVVQSLRDSPPDAIAFVGVRELGKLYAQLFAAGGSPERTPMVVVGSDGWASGFPDGTLSGIVGLSLDATLGDMLEGKLPATDLSADAAAAYDAVTVAALAVEAAGSNRPAAIAEQLPEVTSGATTCRSYQKCVAQLRAGKTVNYVGVTGPLELDRETGSRRAAVIRRSVLGATIIDDTSKRVVVRADSAKVRPG